MHPPGWTGGSGVTSEKVASASVALFNSGAQSAAEIEESLKSSLGVNISMYSVTGNGTAARVINAKHSGRIEPCVGMWRQNNALRPK